MNAPTASALDHIEANTLQPIVRSALTDDSAQIVSWQYQPLGGGSFNSATYRFSGMALSSGDMKHWSTILKTTRSPDGSDDMTSMHYWKRETLAYQSGIFDGLPDGLHAPRCLGVVEQPGQEVWLWLEEIRDEPVTTWTLNHYAAVARQLGHFNGGFLNGRPALGQPWLAKGLLRSWVSAANPWFPMASDVLAHPLVAYVVPAGISERSFRIWSEREAWITFIERQPQCFAHLDAFRRNLIFRSNMSSAPQTALLDWTMAGTAALGEEIAPLVAASLNYMEIPAGQADELDRVVFEAYLGGLGDVGWRGDPRAVRFTYLASAVLRYTVGVSQVFYMLADDQQRAVLERVFGHPAEDLVETWSRTTEFLFDRADEARDLLSSMK